MASGATPQEVVDRLLAAGLTLATGESLTAGLVAATLADVPGCSAVLRGGIVAYDPSIKQAMLDVTPADLAHGIVSAPVAAAMAVGARNRLSADVGIGTTGVAGPEPHDGQPVGSVWIAVAAPGGVASRHLDLAGDRASIRRQTVGACWDLVIRVLEIDPRDIDAREIDAREIDPREIDAREIDPRE